MHDGDAAEMQGKLWQILVFTCCCLPTSLINAGEKLVPELEKFVAERIEEFSKISEERKVLLQDIADYIRGRLHENKTPRLTFVCTHNSRRSHFAQIWAKVAAVHYDLGTVETFSGGTEATAFNPRSVAALKRAGFDIQQSSGSNKSKSGTVTNPHYLVRFSKEIEPAICFSKVYDSPPNPNEQFCAVMTCSEADKACPNVRGCDRRVAIAYTDPKVADNTPQEAATYDDRCAQVAREMLYVMSRVVAQ